MGAPCGHDRASHAWVTEQRYVDVSGKHVLAPVTVSGDCLCSGCQCRGYVPAA